MLPRENAIIGPKDGWEGRTWYLANVSFNKNNPIHICLFYSGFLNDKGNFPGAYNAIVSLNGHDDEQYTLTHAYFLEAFKKLFSNDEVGNY